MTRRLKKPLLLLHLLLLLSGCYTSRLIPEDGYLLTGTSISSEDKKVPTDELQAYMPQRPNK